MAVSSITKPEFPASSLVHLIHLSDAFSATNPLILWRVMVPTLLRGNATLQNAPALCQGQKLTLALWEGWGEGVADCFLLAPTEEPWQSRHSTGWGRP